jgi:hypothetical protein
VTHRVSPTGRIHRHLDELFAQGRPLPEILEEVARLGAQLLRELSQVGDFRPGSLNEVRRRCGKPNCACASPDHPGHGPQYNLTRKVEGRTMARHLRPGPEQATEVNGAICDARPPGHAGQRRR